MNGSYFDFMEIALMPLLIFSSIYMLCIVVYSIKHKNTKNYIYNINFYSYILCSIILSVFQSFSLIYTIYQFKLENYTTNNLLIPLIITMVIFILLIIVLNEFLKMLETSKISLDDVHDKKTQKELNQMLDEIDNLKQDIDDIEIL